MKRPQHNPFSLWPGPLGPWALTLALGLGSLGAWTAVEGGAVAWAQGAPQEEKTEIKVGAADEKTLNVAKKTLEGEKKGTDVFGAEEFAKQRKYESLKSIDTQIAKLNKLLDITPKDHADRPVFLFNLAELHFEKSKYYQNKSFETQDKCFAYQDQGEQGRVESCKKQMKGEQDESMRLRQKTVTLYSDVISGYRDFKNMDEVLFYLGSNLMELKRRDDAIEVYKRLLAEYPRSKYIPNVLVAFGDKYFDEDDMGQALQAYDKVTDSYADSAVYGYALYKKGWCHFNLDNKGKALEMFLATLRYSKKRSDLPNSKPLATQSLKDIVTTYAFIGAAGKAIPFFKKITNDDREEWLAMGERLAVFYSDKGKFDDSIQMYQELISLNKDSVKVVEYQYEIVKNLASRDAYSKETLTELVKLAKLVELADEGKFKDRDDPEKGYKKLRPQIEEYERNSAIRYHREAQQTQNMLLYKFAGALYQYYLEAFPDAKKENRYEMTFFWGELLYKQEAWEPAAKAYEAAFEIEPKGKYRKDIVHAAVLAYSKLVSVKEEKADLSEDAKEIQASADRQKDKDGKEKPPEKVAIPQPKELPEMHKRLIAASDRYIEFAPDGDRIVDVKYTRAYVYYDFLHLEQAADGFKDVAWNHSDHRLATVAANLHLDALNSLQKFDQMEVAVTEYIDKKPIKDEEFLAEVTELAGAIAFKKCTIFDDNSKWREASECFVAFFRKYPESDYGDKALYNAALDFERMRDLGKAIQVRVYLLRNYAQSDLAPITLYNIAGNYHALAIYSQAAKFYELFASNFPNHEKTEDALRNASTFRYGMAQYDKAVNDYEAYITIFGKDKKKEAAEAHFQVAQAYERKQQPKKAFEQYEDYIRKWAKHGTNDNLLQAHVKLGLYYWNRAGSTNRKRALQEFKRTLAVYDKLPEAEKKESVEGRDAAAQALFMIGEDIFEDMVTMKVDARDEKELQKNVVKKRAKGSEAKNSFEQVFKFERPDWTIASFFRIGAAMEDFANNLRQSRPPARLTEDQKEIYRGHLEDAASQIEAEAVAYYIKALDASKAALWFNKFTKEAETRLANIRPKEWRKPSEFHAEPDHVQAGFMGVDFLTKVKDEDRLDDLDAGEDTSSEAEPAPGPQARATE